MRNAAGESPDQASDAMRAELRPPLARLDRGAAVAVQAIALWVVATHATDWLPVAGAAISVLATTALAAAWLRAGPAGSVALLAIAALSGVVAATTLPPDAGGRAAILATSLAQTLVLHRMNVSNRWISPLLLTPVTLAIAWQGAWYWSIGLLGLSGLIHIARSDPTIRTVRTRAASITQATPSEATSAPQQSVDSALRDAQQAREQAALALNAARQAIAEKTRFLAAASHDLRQPVHAIGLFVGALKEEIKEGRGRYLVERLERSMAGLDELFNRLLDISRLDAGTIEPRLSAVPILPLLQTLESRFTPLAEQHKLDFRVHLPAPCTVRSDPALLVEILMNLLSNAFRYTERGGIVLGTRRRGEQLLIQVWDTGIGISPDQTEAIFGEFVQLGNRSRDRRQGLGLGLSIVRRLANSLGASITVRSRPNRGSVFEIALPLMDEPTGSASGPQPDPDWSNLEGLLVLAVDDEIDILTGMEALLASWGCFVMLARNLAEVSRNLEHSERFPDLLITDHRLGGDITSHDVIIALQAQVPLPVPVIVVSGDPAALLPAAAPGLGVAMLPKPVNPDRLRRLVLEMTRPR